MKNVILSCAVFLAFQSQICSQRAVLTLEQQRLSNFQGKWTIEGSEDSYLEVCDFIDGNHIQCIATSTEDGMTDRSISYLTYSSAEKSYIYYGLYGNGSTRMLRGRWENDSFIYEGERQATDKLTKWRITIKPNNGYLDFMEEKSINNGEFVLSAKFQYKRLQ